MQCSGVRLLNTQTVAEMYAYCVPGNMMGNITFIPEPQRAQADAQTSGVCIPASYAAPTHLTGTRLPHVPACLGFVSLLTPHYPPSCTHPRRFVRTSKLYRILLTSLDPDCLTGLPGLLCTISASKERGHETADIPIHIYGPPGTADFLSTMLLVRWCARVWWRGKGGLKACHCGGHTL